MSESSTPPDEGSLPHHLGVLAMQCIELSVISMLLENISYFHFEIHIGRKWTLIFQSTPSLWLHRVRIGHVYCHDFTAISWSLRTRIRVLAERIARPLEHLNMHCARHWGLYELWNVRFGTSSADLLRDSFQISWPHTFNCPTVQQALRLPPRNHQTLTPLLLP